MSACAMVTCGNRAPLIHPDPLRAEIDLNLAPQGRAWAALGDALYGWSVGTRDAAFEASTAQYEWIRDHMASLASRDHPE